MFRHLTLALLLAATLTPGLAHAASDPAHGAMLFRIRCSSCHIATASGPPAGPPLAGVVGRKAGLTSFPGYSEALKHADIIWSADTLSEFLAAPNKKVPGTKMVINVASPQDRADIVAYLAGLK